MILTDFGGTVAIIVFQNHRMIIDVISRIGHHSLTVTAS